MKQNYRPVSILPTLSKIDGSMSKQISSFSEDIFSKLQCGKDFWKGCGKQQCHFRLLGKLKNAVNKGKIFGALLTDLFKATDCLNQEFLFWADFSTFLPVWGCFHPNFGHFSGFKFLLTHMIKFFHHNILISDD